MHDTALDSFLAWIAVDFSSSVLFAALLVSAAVINIFFIISQLLGHWSYTLYIATKIKQEAASAAEIFAEDAKKVITGITLVTAPRAKEPRIAMLLMHISKAEILCHVVIVLQQIVVWGLHSYVPLLTISIRCAMYVLIWKRGHHLTREDLTQELYTAYFRWLYNSPGYIVFMVAFRMVLVSLFVDIYFSLH